MKEIKYKVSKKTRFSPGDLLIETQEVSYLVLGTETKESLWFEAAGGRACYKLLLVNGMTTTNTIVYFTTLTIEDHNWLETVESEKENVK